MSNQDFGPSIQGNAQGIDWQNADRTVGMVNFQDRNTHAFFYWDKRPNQAKSVEMGRPWHDNVVMIRIGNPGERLNVVIRPATDVDKRRFALQWAQFEQQREQRPEGTPLSYLFPEDPARIGNYEASGVYTVEQLGGLSGNAIESLGMGTQGDVNKAQQYLVNAEKGIKNSQMRKMQEDHDREVAALKHQVTEQGKRIDELMAQIRRGVARQQEFDAAGGMERPVHLGQGFDPQQEIINNVGHETRPAPKAETKLARRSRTRLAG